LFYFSFSQNLGPNTKRTFIFQAENDTDKVLWMRALNFLHTAKGNLKQKQNKTKKKKRMKTNKRNKQIRKMNQNKVGLRKAQSINMSPVYPGYNPLINDAGTTGFFIEVRKGK
jgi:hypothetical protein